MKCKIRCEFFDSAFCKCELNGNNMIPILDDCRGEEWLLIEQGDIQEKLAYIQGHLPGLQ